MNEWHIFVKPLHHRLPEYAKMQWMQGREDRRIKQVSDLQRVSWGVIGWQLGWLPVQESLTDHHLLWNRTVGRQNASPEITTHKDIKRRCNACNRCYTCEVVFANKNAAVCVPPGTHWVTFGNVVVDQVWWPRSFWCQLLSSEKQLCCLSECLTLLTCYIYKKKCSTRKHMCCAPRKTITII